MDIYTAAVLAYKNGYRKGIQDTIENEEFKQKYRHDDAGTYYDNKMRLHDQKTGHIVRYGKLCHYDNNVVRQTIIFKLY